MLWPIATFIVLAALLMVYWRGRIRLAEAQQTASRELARALELRKRDLSEAAAQQEALLDSMVEGVLLLDEKDRIRIANRAFAMLFETSGDLRSRTLLEALRQPEFARLVESLEPARPVITEELTLLRPERVIQVNAAAIFNSEGRRQGTILVFHDLTGVKKLERTREEFVANVSHELRTPLTMIKGYTETLLEGANDDAGLARKFLQTIDRNAERLRLLIEDLLTISELESGRVTLNRQPVALRALTEKIISDFASRAEARGVQLRTEVPELTVNADPNRLEQVLCNLVDNGIKYGRLEGAVRIRARLVTGETVEVAVQDDGPGIPAEALERIFERFYRVDKGRSREQGGTGLGLSIVKHIVQSHGGKVWAASEPGRGATFFFTLPALQAEPRTATG